MNTLEESNEETDSSPESFILPVSKVFNQKLFPDFALYQFFFVFPFILWQSTFLPVLARLHLHASSLPPFHPTKPYPKSIKRDPNSPLLFLVIHFPDSLRFPPPYQFIFLRSRDLHLGYIRQYNPFAPCSLLPVTDHCGYTLKHPVVPFCASYEPWTCIAL